MDKKKLGIKLKKETSATGTGASVTPGVGAGVATKYAFKKKVKTEDAPQLAAGKVKDNYAVSHFGFTDAPSVPNRKSKAIDYKELWEAGEYESLASILKQLGAEEDSIKVLIKAVEMGALKPTDAVIITKKALGKKEIKEAKGNKYIDVDDEGDYQLNDTAVAAYLKSVIDSEYVESVDGFMDDNEGYGESSMYFFDVDDDVYKMPTEQEVEDWAKQEMSYYLFSKPDEFPIKETLQEGYAQFRNATKMRSKPDQFHQAVKQVKKKMNEINRIFEYVDRLKKELSEGEDLKYKKYTENAFQQIKESAKALFLKSTKLK